MRNASKVWRILRRQGIRAVFQRIVAVGMRRLARTSDRARFALLRLRTRIGEKSAVAFAPQESPLVSIVIPVHDNLALTRRCLHALAATVGSAPVEIIVVDDASTDGTRDYLASCRGLRVVTAERNRGFLHSANAGAEAARGRYIHFLNNDAFVHPGWLEALLRAFDGDGRIAIAGSQLRALNGTVAEAGAVVWRNGEASNYGRGWRADDPSVAYRRDVDYCSAASLMVRADAFREVGGFSDEFSPAYYEDVDLCFKVRKRGYRVVYEPTSVVTHVEGASNGVDPKRGVKQQQSVHRETFVRKWESELATHAPPDPVRIESAARRLQGSRTILVVDAFVPFIDRSAGGRRLFAIMKIMRNAGWHVMFVAEHGEAFEPYTAQVRELGIEVRPHRDSAAREISRLPVPFDVAWISRPELMVECAPVVRRVGGAAIAYDTVDLHYLRLQRQHDVMGGETGWERAREAELGQMRVADVVVTTSGADRDALSALGIHAEVVPVVEELVDQRCGWEGRKDVLFLGNYSHAPNVDAAEHLLRDIMPLVWEELPDTRVVLAGADPTSRITRLGGERVRVPGYAADLNPLFENAIVLAAPLRYGAGMKGKIVQSLAHGLPVVTSSVGAEGIGMVNGVNGFITDEPRAFADAILRLMRDRACWEFVSRASLALASHFTSDAVAPETERILDRALLARSLDPS